MRSPRRDTSDNLWKLWVFLKVSYLPIIVLALCIVSTFLSPLFLTSMNIMSLLRQVAITGVIAIGAFLVMLVRGVDLSIDGVVPTSSVLVASFVTLGIYPLWLCIALVIGIGLIIGCVNGVLSTYGKIESFVVTLATMITLKGFAYYYYKMVGTRRLIVMDSALTIFGVGKVFNIPMAVIIWISIAAVVIFFLRETIAGRTFVAVGGNPEATSLVGLNNNPYIIIAFMVSGALSAVCGVIVTGLLAIGTPMIGVGYALDAIAAVVVGGGSFQGGKGTVIGVLLGAVILGIISNMLNLMGVAEYPKMMIKGVVIIGAVVARRHR